MAWSPGLFVFALVLTIAALGRSIPYRYADADEGLLQSNADRQIQIRHIGACDRPHPLCLHCYTHANSNFNCCRQAHPITVQDGRTPNLTCVPYFGIGGRRGIVMVSILGKNCSIAGISKRFAAVTASATSSQTQTVRSVTSLPASSLSVLSQTLPNSVQASPPLVARPTTTVAPSEPPSITDALLTSSAQRERVSITTKVGIFSTHDCQRF